MRHRLLNASLRHSLVGMLLPIAIAILVGPLSACATGPPLRPDAQSVLANPGAYDNRRIQLAGRVVDYEPARGDTYRTFRFTLGFGLEETLSVFCSGYEADAIAKASSLVSEAFDSGGILVVTGKLEADKGDGASAELALETVEFGSRSIDVTRGRKTQSGFEVGGFHISPSIGVGATFSP